MKKVAILTLVTLLSIQISWAQKYGHLNLGNMVAAMPATKTADAQIKTFSDQLIAQGQERAKKLQNEYAAILKDMQEGKLSPLQQEQAEEKIKSEQAKLQAFEEEIKQKIAEKRKNLLQPIFNQVEKAIADVAKQKGMTMIFDTSMFNAVMYAAESVDIMADVKAALGLK